MARARISILMLIVRSTLFVYELMDYHSVEDIAGTLTVSSSRYLAAAPLFNIRGGTRWQYTYRGLQVLFHP